MKVLIGEGNAEIVVTKSRFIGRIAPASSAEEAERIISEEKKKYYDARHHCSAYIVPGGNAGASLERPNDDGEPSGTAGRPMLDVLKGAGLEGAVVVVTRYFGGVLLGTGGLVRAYGKAAAEALAAAPAADAVSGSVVRLPVSYTLSGKVLYLAEKEGLPRPKPEYAENVTLTLFLPDADAPRIEKQLRELLGGGYEPAGRESARWYVKGQEAVLL